MKSKSCRLLLLAVTAFFQTAAPVAQTARGNGVSDALVATLAAQGLNPAYLGEMPTVERVKREILGADAKDTALRQIGAFWQLQEIIRALADRRDPDQLTPDERRLIQSYYEAGFYVSQSVDSTLPTEQEKRQWRNRSPYRFSRTDPRFGVEGTDLFKRFFSPAFRAAFDKAIGAEQSRHKAFERSQIEAQKQAQAEVEAYEKQQAAKGQEERAIARCIASGRPAVECIGETFGKALNDVAGVIDLSLKRVPPPAGLRLAGTYTGPDGLEMRFASESASVKWRELVPEPRSYTVQIKDNQVTVTVQNDQTPIVLKFNSDGQLAGPGPTEIKGHVIVGYVTRQTTQTKQIQEYERSQYAPHDLSRDAGGYLHATVPVTVSDPTYKPKTERCNIATLVSSGATTPAAEGVPGFLTALLDPSAKKAPPIPSGLRLVGTYAGQGGLGIEFRAGFAVVGCGEVAVASPYTVVKQQNRVLVKIEDPGNQILLELRPDGKLAGSGPVRINGRVVAGVTSDSNNPVVYQPRTVSCNAGILTPAQEPASAVAAGAAAARETNNTAVPANANPAKSNNGSAPTNATSAGGAAVLSVVTGFSTQPGVANPLAGQNVFLLKESFETALTRGGFRPPAGVSVLKGWAAACTNGQPVCQQSVTAVAASSVTYSKTDASGKVQFQAVPAATYYLFAVIKHNNQLVLWNLRVDLRPGANSATLDERNATRIE